jgi:hypothetical protein
MADRPDEREMMAQFERIVRRVKSSMSYRGSYSTHDILASLVARWLQSGEWARLRALPAEDRHIGESVRRFILDRLTQLRRRGTQEDLTAELALPDDHELAELVELAELRAWVGRQVGELEAGRVDSRLKIPLTGPRDIGRALRLHLDGKTQRQIAFELGWSLGLVNKKMGEGIRYLAVLYGIESGLA